MRGRIRVRPRGVRSRLLAQQLYFQLRRDRLSDFGLNREDIFHFAVIGLRPECLPVTRADHLHNDAHAIALSQYAALNQLRDAEFLTNAGAVARFAFEDKR